MGDLDDYLATLHGDDRRVLEGIRDRAIAIVPDAEQGMSYGMAALRYRGRPLVSVRATAKHLSVFPFSPEVVDAVAADLDGYSLSKGTIRFTAAKPPPDDVVTRIVVARRDEIDAALDR